MNYLLVKRGLYYAPNRQGYTGIKALAGRYLETDASPPDVVAIHEDEAPLFSAACWPEYKIQFLLSELARARDSLTQVIGCFEAARAEGLVEQLSAFEAEPGNLVDLIKRRLAYAEIYARDGLKAVKVFPGPAGVASIPDEVPA